MDERSVLQRELEKMHKNAQEKDSTIDQMQSTISQLQEEIRTEQKRVERSTKQKELANKRLTILVENLDMLNYRKVKSAVSDLCKSREQGLNKANEQVTFALQEMLNDWQQDELDLCQVQEELKNEREDLKNHLNDRIQVIELMEEKINRLELEKSDLVGRLKSTEQKRIDKAIGRLDQQATLVRYLYTSLIIQICVTAIYKNRNADDVLSAQEVYDYIHGRAFTNLLNQIASTLCAKYPPLPELLVDTLDGDWSSLRSLADGLYLRYIYSDKCATLIGVKQQIKTLLEGMQAKHTHEIIDLGDFTVALSKQRLQAQEEKKGDK